MFYHSVGEVQPVNRVRVVGVRVAFSLKAFMDVMSHSRCPVSLHTFLTGVKVQVQRRLPPCSLCRMGAS